MHESPKGIDFLKHHATLHKILFSRVLLCMDHLENKNLTCGSSDILFLMRLAS